MKIDLYSMMHNEAVILPYYFRHYDPLVNRYFIWEDQSTDGTRELLQQNKKVTLLPVPQSKIDDHFWVRQMFPQYRRHSMGRADYVFTADADEFIYHPNLIGLLEKKKQQGVDTFRCKGYTMVADAFPTTTGQIYEEIKMGVYDPWSCKRAIHSTKVKLFYSPGRHFIKSVERLDGGEVVDSDGSGILLLHYRFLGPEYFKARSARNMERMGERNIRYKFHKSNLPESEFRHTFKWYDSVRHEAIKVL
jgi:hypothetical protein